MQRTCKKCKKRHVISKFSVRSDGRNGGYFSWCKDCENERTRERYWKYHDKEIKRGRDKGQKYKQTVLDHYGHKCVCCGVTGDAFLAIDHINGDGGEFRKKIGTKEVPSGTYVWIIKNNYPDNLQTLCFNCNWAKTRYGICPHKTGEAPCKK